MHAPHHTYLKLKRALDVVLSVLLLVVLSPVFAVVAVFSFMFLGRPIFFVQERPGKGGRLFKMYKFRTMAQCEPENASLSAVEKVATDEQRLNGYGALLRKTSLDELPELFNILKGDMSFVGPRPLLPEYLELYSPEQARRHEVRPGLTGLAQVKGRNALDWSSRFAYDVEYVDKVSWALDLSILVQTFGVVFTHRGVSAESCATVEPFRGNKDAETPSANKLA